ncbi:hypothetical protein F4677DRAFT_442061 [Hypoxylon crocopeplum]|nr:hypothetical protein F4677DRAFT_442061 [Hypoxylon crocopeplum]
MTQKELTSSKGQSYEIGKPAPSAALSALPPFDVDVDWQPGGDWHTLPGDFIEKTGITRWKIEVSGLIFKYKLCFTNVKLYDYQFVDASGDSYENNTHTTGDHYINYNSDNPAIKHISGS